VPHHEDRALLLRRYPFGESSLVVHALCRDRGRVALIAKGAYRPTSRFAYALDRFDELELGWSARPGQELGTLRAAGVLRRRARMVTDLARYRTACAALELADVAARPSHPDPALFDLLSECLDRLAGERVDPWSALVAFDLGFLQNLGLAPALERCAACAGDAPPAGVERGRGAQAVAFSSGAGGRLCAACAAEARASGRRVGTAPVAALRAAAALLGARGSALERISVDPRLAPSVRDLVTRFLEYHLETRPRARRELPPAPTPRRREARRA
jgi:DNA repair protein RecO (recombination protein O)